jgi:hypothetical protein
LARDRASSTWWGFRSSVGERTMTPMISEPLVGGRGWPFASPGFDVGDHGYVMTEHVLDGVARSYRPADGTTIGVDGRWDTVEGDTAPYRTRLYVVRPENPERFNGVVLVNWQNVTAGVDLGAPTVRNLEHGYAWVGVTSQRVAIDGRPAVGGFLPATTGLRGWDPERYGTLSHPGDEFSYDIFGQAGRAVSGDRNASGVDPLGGLQPRVMIATGSSQSSMRLGSYLNIAHQRDRVFDGFLLNVHWGMCPYPPDQELQASFAPVGAGLTAGSAQVRDDGGVPILVVSTETEFANMLPVRQRDTTTYRHWEIAGCAHANAESIEEMGAVFARDELPNILAGGDRNVVDYSYVVDAALTRLTEWIESGTPPPSMPLLEVDEDGRSIARDGDGNGLGGIRLPDLAAPTGVHLGSNPGNPLAALSGQSLPFSVEQLARYSGADDYVSRWDAAVDDVEAFGLVLPDAVDALRARGRTIASSLWS